MFHTLAAHPDDHPDEAAVVVGLRRYGDAVFPGVKKAKLVHWLRFPDVSASELEARGIFPIGRVGGCTDEHPINGNGGKDDECSFSLLCNVLKIRQYPEIQDLLKYIIENDTRGKSQPFDMARIMKAIHFQYPTDSNMAINWGTQEIGSHIDQKLSGETVLAGDPQKLVSDWLSRRQHLFNTEQDLPIRKIVEYGKSKPSNHPFVLANMAQIKESVNLALDAMYHDQLHFHTTAVLEYKLGLKKIEDVPGPNGQLLKIATVVSDHRQIARYARYKDIDVLIQIKPSDQEWGNGFVQIHTNQERCLDMSGVALMLRKKEQEIQGKADIKDERLLRVPGNLRAIPQWFYNPKIRSICNGTLTTWAPPTILSVETIQKCVKKGIENTFESRKKLLQEVSRELDAVLLG